MEEGTTKEEAFMSEKEQSNTLSFPLSSPSHMVLYIYFNFVAFLSGL